MASSDIAIRVRGLSKAYTIRHQGSHHITLAEAALSRFRQPFKRHDRELFWALNDVSFDVSQGQVLGIIGRNGAGKSTLLKVLSRITAPTTGSVELYGRVGSLLEVGTGFHPELTGRENIYLNGAILGMRKSEINRQFDEIVDFAGVEKFLDTPVKRYSSGMYVRLAFAVAAHLRTEILIVDEVLAVGDAEFQKKCLGKMGEVASDGRTVLFVSHNMEALARLSHDSILLAEGRLVMQARSRQVTELYLHQGLTDRKVERDLRSATRPSYPQSGDARIVGVRLLSGSPVLAPGDPLRLRVGAESDGTIDAGVLVVIHSRDGSPVATCVLDSVRIDEATAIDIELPSLPLRPAAYSIELVLTTPSPSHGYRDHDIVPDALGFEIADLSGSGESRSIPDSWGSLRLDGRLHNVKRVQRTQGSDHTVPGFGTAALVDSQRA